MLSLSSQKPRAQNYVTIFGKGHPHEVVITDPKAASYSLSYSLGAGSYGAVNAIKKRKNPCHTSDDAIFYKTEVTINHSYAFKQLYDHTQYDMTAISQEIQDSLWSPTDISTYSSQLLPFTDAHLVTVARDTEYQMAIEAELKKSIESSPIIDWFLAKKRTTRLQMLQELKAEANYITRYYAASGENAIVLEGEPRAEVMFHCKHAYASIHYQPAIAMLMPKISGITLWDYPENKFHLQFSFSALLNLFTKIIAAFSHLHALNILHLDANPKNIMLNAEQQIEFVDFGMARNIVNIDGKLSITPRAAYTSYEYWRKDRFRPENSEKSDAIVSVEDDLFTLVACLHYLTREYQRCVKEVTLATCFMNYLDQIKTLLDEPGACMDNGLSSINNVISLIMRLYTLESKLLSDETKAQTIIEATEELNTVAPMIGHNSLLATQARTIIEIAQPQKTSPNSIAESRTPLNGLTIFSNKKTGVSPGEFREFIQKFSNATPHDNTYKAGAKKHSLFYSSGSAFQPVIPKAKITRLE